MVGLMNGWMDGWTDGRIVVWKVNKPKLMWTNEVFVFTYINFASLILHATTIALFTNTRMCVCV